MVVCYLPEVGYRQCVVVMTVCGCHDSVWLYVTHLKEATDSVWLSGQCVVVMTVCGCHDSVWLSGQCLVVCYLPEGGYRQCVVVRGLLSLNPPRPVVCILSQCTR